jgi:hypothetical protein
MPEVVLFVSSRVAAVLALYPVDSHKLPHSENGGANFAAVFSGTVTFRSSRYKEIELNVSPTNFERL